MKAAVYYEFGPPEVLQIAEVERPTPGVKDILVRNYATTVAKEDPDVRSAPGFNGFSRPKNPILGMYFSGTVEKVGKEVTLFKAGDEVYGSAAMKFGACAEYICISENAAVVHKPAALSYQQAAAVPNGAITTIPFLFYLGKVKEGDKVLLTGASGTVGTSAIQLAKHLGAHVTGVCSTSKIDPIRSLGADQVIDYTQEDFTRSGLKYDVIFDTVGSSSFSSCRASLNPGGVYLTTVPTLEMIPHLLNPFKNSVKTTKFAATALRPTKKKLVDLAIINQIIENGEYLPVIDKVFPLEEIAAAHRYVAEGHKTGDVVISV